MGYFNVHKVSMNLWRNATGEIREICTLPPAKHDFYWHASITSIATSGEFSLSPGVERVVTLPGDGEMFLESVDRFNHTLKSLQPFSFAADLVVKAKLTAERMSIDFNIMACLDVCKAKVRIAERTSTISGSRGGVVSIINEAWQLGDKLLTTDQGAYWFGGRHTLRLLQSQGKLLLNEINWPAGHSPDQVQ